MTINKIHLPPFTAHFRCDTARAKRPWRFSLPSAFTPRPSERAAALPPMKTMPNALTSRRVPRPITPKLSRTCGCSARAPMRRRPWSTRTSGRSRVTAISCLKSANRKQAATKREAHANLHVPLFLLASVTRYFLLQCLLQNLKVLLHHA